MSFNNWHIHVSYVVIAAILSLGAWIAVHSWIAEHDARLQAEKTIAVAEQTATALSQQIAERDAQAQKQEQVIVKVVHDVQTPQQAAQALPQVLPELPVPVVSQPNGDWLVPATDVVPMFDQIADDKVCRSQLTTCTQDLVDEKSIVTQKDSEIVALKKKPSFWKRTATTLKIAAVSVAIGVALSHGL